METIVISRGTDGYVARFSDPRVEELFGTDTLPTPFTLAADPVEVLAVIAAKNPDAVVTLTHRHAYPAGRPLLVPGPGCPDCQEATE